MSEQVEKVAPQELCGEQPQGGHWLKNNPFYILGTAPNESLEELTDRYEDAIDDHLVDEHMALKLYQQLSSSLPRLEAEVGWLPGVDANEARQAIDSGQIDPAPDWSALANVNFHFALLTAADEPLDAADLQTMMHLWATVDTDVVTETILRQRDASGFPHVNGEQVSSELNRLMQCQAEGVFALLPKSEKALPAILSQALETGPEETTSSAFANLLSMEYQHWVQSPLDRLAKELDAELPALQKLLDEEVEGEREVDIAEYHVIEEALTEKVSTWAILSRPLRWNSYCKGMDEKRSAGVVGSFLNNAIALHTHAPASALKLARAAYDMTDLMPGRRAKAEEVYGSLQDVSDLYVLEEREPEFCQWANTAEEKIDKLEWGLIKHENRHQEFSLENSFFQELITLLQRTSDEEVIRGAWVRVSMLMGKLERNEPILHTVHQLVEIEKHFPLDGIAGKRVKARWDHILWIEIQFHMQDSMMKGMKENFSRWVEKGYERFGHDQEKRLYIDRQKENMEKMPDDSSVGAIVGTIMFIIIMIFVFISAI